MIVELFDTASCHLKLDSSSATILGSLLIILYLNFNTPVSFFQELHYTIGHLLSFFYNKRHFSHVVGPTHYLDNYTFSEKKLEMNFNWSRIML